MNILTNLTPVLTGITIIGILVGVGRSLYQNKIMNAVLQILIGCVIVYLIKNPSNFDLLGGYVVGFVKTLGGSINE